MPTTTNYGWTTPADTDLVKDGAAAIRTLGSSIDTSVKSLNAGTTAGDIDYYTSSTAKARVGIGTTGQVLTVAGGVPSWATASSGGMTLISTTTLTGASVTISSIPATYNNLRMVIRNYRPTNDTQPMYMRFNADATASRHASFTAYGAASGAFGATNVSVYIDNDNATATGMAIIDVPDYANTTTWKMSTTFNIGNDTTTPANLKANVYWGFYNQTGAISSFSFFPNAGNFTSGEILLYGVK
jgi:hypothetical protein